MSRSLNYVYRRLVLGVLRKLSEIHARLARRRFYCLALAGKVRDGIFVNSDMTVSCNCQDIDGAGQLGNLRTTPFEELFTGPAAQRLRRELAAGRLPIDRCAVCFHLRTATPREAESQWAGVELPRGLSVENTVHCNLRCLSCCRQQILKTRKNGRALSLADFEIVGRTLARLDADYCGFYNLGEPFFSNAILRELEVLRRHRPAMHILVSTNGLLLDTDEKREAALLADHLLFSIDGIDTPMVRRYQRGGDFDRAYANLRSMVEFRNRRGLRKPRIDWKYVVFRWNDRREYIERAIDLARRAGADSMQFTFARNPGYGISWRYLFSPFFRSLGVPDGWRCRVVWLAAQGQEARRAA
ncbi:MAG: radical SAM protein [Thermoguttaceae bacterium]|jgi:pyruvate-formate lyase-activating enzyme|nr:radical SAM protein [Thermoguttaceae bacterium]